MELADNRPFGFTSDLDSDMYFKISVNRPIKSFVLSYVIIGPGPAKVCNNCA